MINKRLIGVILVRGGIVVQSIGFRRFLPVGRVEVAAEFFNLWGLDEIVLFDIDASVLGRRPDLDMVRRVSRKCFVPLAVGGGVAAVGDMNALVHSGADKVSINSAALKDPDLIAQAAALFGDQCVLVTMDVRRSAGGYEVCGLGGTRPAGMDPVSWARRAVSLGAGEILVNSIDRDGQKTGYDLELVSLVADAVDVPVIACGGAGHPGHFLDVLQGTQASAAAAGNFFHFIAQSPTVTKSFLRARGLPGRFDTPIMYEHAGFDEEGRVTKRPEEYYEHLRFEIIRDEHI